MWCILSLPVSSYPGTHSGTKTMNFSEPSGKRGNRSSPREQKQTKKNNGVQKTQTLPWSSCFRGNIFTNLNAVASNLPRTCFKSKSLPNSVIFITELHLRVFLTLCTSSDSENPFEPDGRLERREVPDRLWITKITYLTVGINKLQRILPRT